MSRRHTGIRAHHRLKVSAYREVPGRYYDTPKELWDLSLSGMKGTPRQVAKAALRANSALLGLDPKLRDLGVRQVKQTVAGHHVIFGQKHLDTPIHRAYVTVHMNRKNEVYLVKNRAVPAHLLPASKEIQISASKARRIAVASVKAKGVRVLASEKTWYPVKDRVRFAYKFRVRRETPAHEWLIYVDAVTGRILSKYDNLSLRRVVPACSIQIRSLPWETGFRCSRRDDPSVAFRIALTSRSAWKTSPGPGGSMGRG